MNELQQLDRLAALLGALSQPAAAVLLARMDEPTREAIQLRLSGETVSDEPCEELLESFRRYIVDRQANIEGKRFAPGNATRQPARGINIEFIYSLDDRSLDALLQAVPAETTIRMLRCSPRRFVERILERVTREDADHIIDQIESKQVIDLQELNHAQQQFLSVVEKLTDAGKLQLASRHGGPTDAT